MFGGSSRGTGRWFVLVPSAGPWSRGTNVPSTDIATVKTAGVLANSAVAAGSVASSAGALYTWGSVPRTT